MASAESFYKKMKAVQEYNSENRINAPVILIKPRINKFCCTDDYGLTNVRIF